MSSANRKGQIGPQSSDENSLWWFLDQSGNHENVIPEIYFEIIYKQLRKQL